MSYKKLIPFINTENELEESILKQVKNYSLHGADELFLYNYCEEDNSREQFLHLVQSVAESIDIPVIIGLYVNRLEDVKKALYTGALKVVIKYSLLADDSIIKEATDRFGKDKLILELDDYHMAFEAQFQELITEWGVYGVLIKHLTLTDALTDTLNSYQKPIYIRDSLIRNNLADLLAINNVIGVATNHYENGDLIKVKHTLKAEGIKVNTYDSSLSFDQFKLNGDGLIPVITQDYKTNEVLMLAYMNKEAFEKTVETGVMTYYSRSRQELWLKGDTSGHFQYVKSLTIDCDNDTILAKVQQIGAACHTGSKTCFFTDLVRKDYEETNPLKVMEDVYNVIMDRKQHPKEGSYTNYLFDKGIDKILKKCGEEATEIIIAAKNPDSAELKYEISDFLYHMMVLMAECGLDWKDIITELAHRR